MLIRVGTISVLKAFTYCEDRGDNRPFLHVFEKGQYGYVYREGEKEYTLISPIWTSKESEEVKIYLSKDLPIEVSYFAYPSKVKK